MSNHFAKYLPVEGEIKEGDMMFIKFPHPQGQIRKCWYIYKHEEHEEQLMIDDPKDPNRGRGFLKRNEVKKAKLFLCSRDIQIGDLVFASHEEYAGNVIDELDLIKWRDHYHAYKMVGEILTPDIKEGQEFTEKEVEYLTIGNI
jgi:hypothetical protein